MAFVLLQGGSLFLSSDRGNVYREGGACMDDISAADSLSLGEKRSGHVRPQKTRSKCRRRFTAHLRHLFVLERFFYSWLFAESMLIFKNLLTAWLNAAGFLLVMKWSPSIKHRREFLI